MTEQNKNEKTFPDQIAEQCCAITGWQCTGAGFIVPAGILDEDDVNTIITLPIFHCGEATVLMHQTKDAGQLSRVPFESIEAAYSHGAFMIANWLLYDLHRKGNKEYLIRTRP